MPLSDDELSSLGVLSVSSDCEGPWETATPTEDYDFEDDLTSSFRMPHPESSYQPRCVAAPPDSFQALDFSQCRPSKIDSVELIVFAPVLAARSICTTLLRMMGTRNVTIGYYNGTTVRLLADELAVSQDYRKVCILYYSTVDSYDPVPEYKQYIERMGPLPCVAISDAYVDPFCLSSEMIITSSPESLVNVKTRSGQEACIPIPVTLLESIPAGALAPEGALLFNLSAINAKKNWNFNLADIRSKWKQILVVAMLMMKVGFLMYSQMSSTSVTAPSGAYSSLEHAPTAFPSDTVLTGDPSTDVAIAKQSYGVSFVDPLYWTLNTFVLGVRDFWLYLSLQLDALFTKAKLAALETSKFTQEKGRAASEVANNGYQSVRSGYERTRGNAAILKDELGRKIRSQRESLRYYLKDQTRNAKMKHVQASEYARCVWKNRKQPGALSDCKQRQSRKSPYWKIF